MRILYVSDCHVESPVFQSQVRNHVDRLSEFTATELLSFSKVRKHERGVFFLPPKSFTRLPWWLIARKLQRAVGWRTFDVVIFRGYMAGMLCLTLAPSIPNVRFVYDLRGDMLDEIRRSTGLTHAVNRLFLPAIRANLARQMALASLVFTVSSPLADLVKREYGKDSAAVHSFSTVVSDDFKHSHEMEATARRQLGFADDDVVFTYVGGLVSWQNVDVMLRAFVGYVNRWEKGRFLLVTRDQARAHALVGPLDDSVKRRVTIMSAEHAEVPFFLNAGDVGLLVREDIALNRVASPTKYGEYINCGLSVIASDVGADFSRHAREHAANVSLIRGNDASELLAAMLAYRTRPPKHCIRVNSARDVAWRQFNLISEMVGCPRSNAK